MKKRRSSTAHRREIKRVTSFPLKSPISSPAQIEFEGFSLTLEDPQSDLSEPLSSGYNPIAVESAWYDWWQAKGFFEPELQDDGMSALAFVP